MRRRISPQTEARVIALLEEVRAIENSADGETEVAVRALDVAPGVMARVRHRAPGRPQGPAAGPVGWGLAAGTLGALVSAAALAASLATVQVPIGPGSLAAVRPLGAAGVSLLRALGALLASLGRVGLELTEVAARVFGDGDFLLFLTSAIGLSSVAALLMTVTFALWRDLRPAAAGPGRLTRRHS